MAFSKAQTQAIMHKRWSHDGSGGTGIRENNGDHPSGPVFDEGVRNRSGDILVIAFTRAAAEEMRRAGGKQY